MGRASDAIPLRELVSDARGGFASGARDPDGIVQLRMNNVAPDGSFDWSSLTRVPADRSGIEAYKLQPGDVVFNATNSAALVGKTALFLGYREPVVFSNHFTRLRTLRDRLLPEYLAFWLQAQWRLRVFEQVCDRWIGQAAVQRDKLLDLAIPCPLLAEQRCIAARLREQLAPVERARQAAGAAVAAAHELAGADLRTLFDTEASLAWPRRRLGDVAEIVGGIQKSPTRTPVRNHRPFLTVRNVQRGYLDLSMVERFEVTSSEIDRLRLLPGDILVVEGNGSLAHIGRNALFEGDGQEWVHQNHVIRVRLNARIAVPHFVSLYLNCNQGRRQMIEKARTSSGLYTLSAGKVALLEIPVPSLRDQEEAIAALGASASRARAVLGAADASLAALEALPTALLRMAFR